MVPAVLRIGALATQCGVSIDTIRYYERCKLLPRAGRSRGGFRLFAPDAVERIRFIKQAQELGFSLEEIGALLTPGGGATCRSVRDLLQAKLTALDERMRAMQEFRHVLTAHLAACERELQQRGEAAECPVMADITRSQRR
jgi:MerR family mercuric resistance operon transcriptional regulator